jgi:hypothetical protein
MGTQKVHAIDLSTDFVWVDDNHGEEARQVHDILVGPFRQRWKARCLQCAIDRSRPSL